MTARHLGRILTIIFLLFLIELQIAPAITIAAAVSEATPNRQSPNVAPVMTDELMARLIKYTLSDPETSSVPGPLCKVLDRCDGTADLPIKFAQEKVGEVVHLFGVPPQAGSKDIWDLTCRVSSDQ